MIKKISKVLAVFSAAAAISSCGIAVSAAEYDTVLPADEPAAQVMLADYQEDYQIKPVEKEYIGSDDKYEYYQDKNGEVTKKEKKNWVKIILIALGISLVITGITVYMIYRSYKYNGMTEPYEYKNKAPLELTEREDQLIDVRVTSRHINNDK